jgi:pimeloyl-ACP methyl ester carboxylesterase
MNYEVMAEDLVQFMAAHHLPRAHVLGHSMGGKTAMQTALLHPDKIDKLVVVDIAPRAYSPRHGQIFEGALSLDPAAYQTRAELEAALAPSIPEKTVRQFLLKNVTRDGNGAFRWKLNLKDIFKNYDRLSEALPSEGSFEGPTLFIRGELSKYICEPDLELIRRMFPHSQMQAIKNAGHWVHSEQPQAFLGAVIDFLTAK